MQVIKAVHAHAWIKVKIKTELQKCCAAETVWISVHFYCVSEYVLNCILCFNLCCKSLALHRTCSTSTHAKTKSRKEKPSMEQKMKLHPRILRWLLFTKRIYLILLNEVCLFVCLVDFWFCHLCDYFSFYEGFAICS